MGAQGFADAPGVHLMTSPPLRVGDGSWWWRGPTGSEESSLCDVLVRDVLMDRVGPATCITTECPAEARQRDHRPFEATGSSLYPELLSKAKPLLAEALSIASGDPTRSRAESARPPKPQDPA
jgi:hypothetical protein